MLQIDDDDQVHIAAARGFQLAALLLHNPRTHATCIIWIAPPPTHDQIIRDFGSNPARFTKALWEH
jgi:hypothetical protein